MKAKLTLDVTEKQHVGVDADVFQSLAQSIVGDLNKEACKQGYTLSLVLVSDDEIQDLNKTYREKDCPTDVLSFSFLEGEEEMLSTPSQQKGIGELYISVQTAQKQADEQKHDLMLELKILFVHGLLHILGHDHEKASDREKMEALERRYLGDKAGLIGRAYSE